MTDLPFFEQLDEIDALLAEANRTESEVPDVQPADEAPPALFSLPQRKALPLFDGPSVPLTMRTLANLRNSGRVIE